VRDGDRVEAEGKGDGPIAAAFDAVNRVVGWEVELEDLTIRSATPGGDAVGEVILRIRVAGQTFTGTGASTDVVDAAVRGYLHALNKAAHGRAEAGGPLEGTTPVPGSKELKGV
jgi:2-isopropylmalate synthase